MVQVFKILENCSIYLLPSAYHSYVALNLQQYYQRINKWPLSRDRRDLWHIIIFGRSQASLSSDIYHMLTQCCVKCVHLRLSKDERIQVWV